MTFDIIYLCLLEGHIGSGGLAQLARAPALHAGGRGFESHILHQMNYEKSPYNECFSFFIAFRTVEKEEK